MNELKEAGLITKDDLDEFAKKLVEARPEETEVELHAKAGVLGGFAKTEIMGVPIGAAGVGLLTVGIWDALRGLLGGILPAQIPQWLIPVIGAWVVQTRIIKGWMGADAANAAGLILTADAFQASPFSPRKFVSGLVSGQGLTFQQVRPAGSVGGNTTQSVDQYLKAQGLI